MVIEARAARVSRVEEDGSVTYLGTMGEAVDFRIDGAEDEESGWKAVQNFGFHTEFSVDIKDFTPEAMCILVGMSMVDYSIQYEDHIVRGVE